MPTLLAFVVANWRLVLLLALVLYCLLGGPRRRRFTARHLKRLRHWIWLRLKHHWASWRRKRGAKRTGRDPIRDFSPEDRRELMRLAGGQCEWQYRQGGQWHRCQATTDQDVQFHADHVWPWSKGGMTTLANGAWLCANHNMRKSGSKPTMGYLVRLTEARTNYYRGPIPNLLTQKVAA